MLEIIEKKATLDSILGQMDQMDAGLLELDLDEMEALGDSLAEKTDAYKAVLDRLEFRAAELKSQIDELTILRRAMDAKHDQIRRRMAMVMEGHGIDRLPGRMWNARLAKAAALEFEAGREKPNDEDLALFPSWVTVELSWKKADIKREMQSGVGHLPGAYIAERKSVVFRAVRE